MYSSGFLIALMALIASVQLVASQPTNVTWTNSTAGSPPPITLPEEAHTILSDLSPYILHFAFAVALFGLAYCKREFIVHQAARARRSLSQTQNVNHYAGLPLPNRHPVQQPNTANIAPVRPSARANTVNIALARPSAHLNTATTSLPHYHISKPSRTVYEPRVSSRQSASQQALDDASALDIAQAAAAALAAYTLDDDV